MPYVVSDHQNVSGAGPAVDLVPITPGDPGAGAGPDYGECPPSRALKIQGAGTIRFTNKFGVVRNSYAYAGDFAVADIEHVHATGTTASGIEAYVDAKVVWVGE